MNRVLEKTEGSNFALLYSDTLVKPSPPTALKVLPKSKAVFFKEIDRRKVRRKRRWLGSDERKSVTIRELELSVADQLTRQQRLGGEARRQAFFDNVSQFDGFLMGHQTEEIKKSDLVNN